MTYTTVMLFPLLTADDEEAVMAYRNAAVAKAEESREGFGEWSVTQFIFFFFPLHAMTHLICAFTYKVEHRPVSPIDLELQDTQELDTGPPFCLGD